MAKKIDTLIQTLVDAVADCARADDGNDSRVLDARNALKSQFVEAGSKIAQLCVALNTAEAKFRDLVKHTQAAQPSLQYDPFDASKVKPGDAVEARNPTTGAHYAPFRFLCVSSAGHVVVETPAGVPHSYYVRNVRVPRKTKLVTMYAMVTKNRDGSYSGNLSNDQRGHFPELVKGYTYVAQNLPVTVTVSE